MGWLVISIVTFIALIVVFVITGFFAMIMANGYMGGTDPMVAAYVICQGAAMLVLSLLSGLGGKKLSMATKMPLWVAGLITTGAAAAFLFVLSFFAFFFAVTFFAP